MDFPDVLTWLAEREGQTTVLLITGPAEEDSPTIVRANGVLSAMQVVADGKALTDGSFDTASYKVGDVLVSMYGPEFERAEHYTDLGFVVVHQRHAVFEWRIPGEE